MPVDDCLYRFVEVRGGIPNSLGTAFYIDGGVFVSCWHVIQAHSAFSKYYDSDNNKVIFDPSDTRLEGKQNPIYNVSWRKHRDTIHNQHYDIAIGIPHPGEPTPDQMLVVELTARPNELGLLNCRGFGEADTLVLGTREFRYTSDDAMHGRFAIDSTLAPGYSGSPVFEGERVIAIVCSRDIYKGCGYCLPVSRFWWWLENLVDEFPVIEGEPPGEVVLTAEQKEIKKYPTSISVSRIDAPIDELYKIGYKSITREEDLREFFNKVNVNIAKSCNTKVDDQRYCIDDGGLSSKNARETWKDALRNAWICSGRTIGAILETGRPFDEEFLSKTDKKIVSDLKLLLKKKK